MIRLKEVRREFEKSGLDCTHPGLLDYQLVPMDAESGFRCRLDEIGDDFGGKRHTLFRFKTPGHAMDFLRGYRFCMFNSW